jgi:hypothetical protein
MLALHCDGPRVTKKERQDDLGASLPGSKFTSRLDSSQEKSGGSVGQFEFRSAGNGLNTSVKNRTYNATEIIAIHHGLSTIGNKNISSHSHQDVRDDRLPSEFIGFA